MASCLTIVDGALRKIGVLGAGREPRLADREDTFEALKSLYRQLITNGSFGRLRDVIPTGEEYTAYENERIFRNSDATLSITLPETIQNWEFWAGWWIYGIYPNEPVPVAGNTTNPNIRTPRDCAVVTIIDAFIPGTFDFIYNGQTKLWQSIYDLSITDEAPLSFGDPEGLKATLGLQIMDEFGGTMGDATIRLAQNFQSALVNRFSMPSRPVCGEYF